MLLSVKRCECHSDIITAPGRALRAAVEVSAQKMTFGQTHYYMTIVALSRRREQSGSTILDTHEHLTSRTNQQLSILTHLSERNAELVTLRSEIKYSG